MARSKNRPQVTPADNAAREALDALVADYSDERAVAWLERKFSSFAPGLAAGRSVPPFGDRNERDYFASARILGFVRSMPGQDGANRPLVVASVRMKRPLGERTSRLVQFSFAKKVVREAVENPPPGIDGLCSQGLFFFHDDEGDFRLSLVSGRIDGRRIDWSSARRNSFYCRHGRPCNTMRKRLGAALPSSAKLAEAFSVEALTKEFYEHLFRWYEWACDPTTGVAFPNKIGDRTDDRKMLPEAIIRLITRLLFVWFVRERRLVPSEIFTREWAEGNLLDFHAESMDGKKGTSYYRAVLQNLFFATLNVPPDERTWAEPHRKGGGLVNDYRVVNRFRFSECFRDPDAFFAKGASRESLLRGVPFLNCALFDCLDRAAESKDGKPADHDEDVYLDGFSRNPRRQAVLPNALFFGDGSDETGHEGILNLLAAYDFTIDENAASDGDVALDPELLGKVFENLLGAFNPETKEAARKMTGSFYTPREIVDYMVEQSLRAHLRAKVPAAADDAKLDDLFSRAAAGEGDKGLLFSRAERGDLLEALYGCRSLDPACGSGAFPMGMLHAMTRLLAVLDPTGIAIQTRILRRHKEDLLNLSRDDRLERAEREKRTADLEKLLAEQTANPDYARKLWIIENCIYGVDIQPIAAQISKLRFYISLLCDQPDADAASFVALPNLESKFVCANTLLPLPDPESGLDFGGERIKRLREDLREIRHRIFQARGWQTKRKYQERDKAKREEIKAAVTKALSEPDEATIAQQLQAIAENEKARAAVAEPRWATRKKQEMDFNARLFGEEPEQGELFERYDANAEKRAEIDRRIATARRIIEKERTKASRVAAHDSPAEECADLVAAWDPYDQNRSENFFDPNWMFDVTDGFDIVIGNPPYVFSRNSDMKGFTPELKAFYKRKYLLSQYQINLYPLFIERGAEMVRKQGVLCFITPNNWLTVNTNSELRKFLLSKSNLSILNFDAKVFDSADVDSSIFYFINQDSQSENDCVNLYEWNHGPIQVATPHRTMFLNSDGYLINFALAKNEHVLSVLSAIERHSSPLSSFASIKCGLGAYGKGDGIPPQTEDMIKRRVYHSSRKEGIDWFPYIEGEDVQRYYIGWKYREFLKYGKHLREPRGDWNLFSSPRILVRQIPSQPPYCISACYTNETILNDRNSMNVVYIKTSPSFLLGVINCKPISFWFVHKFGKLSRGIFPQFKINELAKFPIPSNPPAASVRGIESLVDHILATKKGNPAADTSVLEKKIDEIVYKLYGLTEEEVAIVEGRSATARPESPPRPGSAGDGRRTADDGRRAGGATKRPSVLDEDTDID